GVGEHAVRAGARSVDAHQALRAGLPAGATVPGVRGEVLLATVLRLPIAVAPIDVAHADGALEVHTGRFGVGEVAGGAGADALRAHQPRAALEAAHAAVVDVGAGGHHAAVGQHPVAIGVAVVAGAELAGGVDAADL